MTAEEKIINAAHDAFMLSGVKNVTMDSISQAAGVSKRTVYELFKDKDDLVIAVIKYMIIRHNKAMIELLGNTENVIEALFIVMENESSRREDLSPLFIQDLQKYLPKINDLFYDHEKLAELSAGFAFLKKGIEQGVFRKDLRLEIVDLFMHEMIGIIHTSERLKGLKMDKMELLNNIFIPYFRGICSKKGLSLMDKYFKNLNEELPE
ncbi:MAG TPA: TetR/AcrR family transcriptional regulator [Lentimicrobium sp.]|nr:TetR/AcrR family transcriptional regulator [Lentimicrobium sp.]